MYIYIYINHDSSFDKTCKRKGIFTCVSRDVLENVKRKKKSKWKMRAHARTCEHFSNPN